MKIRKLGIYFVVVLLMVSFSLVEVFAVGIGDYLPEPENGWTRYDIEKESNVAFLQNAWMFNVTDDSRFYGKTLPYTDIDFIHDKNKPLFKFKFKGNKFRIIACKHNLRSDDIQIYVDGVNIGKYSEYDIDITIAEGQILLFESDALADKIHTVEIYSNHDSGSNISIDAIDIFENGYLVHINTPTNLVATAGDSKVNL